MNLIPSKQPFNLNHAMLAVCVAVFSTAAFASHGGFVLSGYLDTEGEIALVIPHENMGFSLSSATENLVPLPPGDLSADPRPYDFMLHNGTGFITFGSLLPVHIGGTFNTGIRLSDGDVSVLTGHYGGVSPEQFRVFDVAPPEVTATLDVGGRLMIHGTAAQLTRVLVVSENSRPALGGSFDEEWFHDLAGVDGSLSLPFHSDLYPISEDFDLVAIYCQEDGNCREIEFVTEFTCSPNMSGDVNGDGRVGFADFLIMSFNFGKEVPNQSYGDLDCNGTVEFADFLVTSTCFGCGTIGAEAVPEPRNNLMIVLALTLCVSCWCRTRTR